MSVKLTAFHRDEAVARDRGHIDGEIDRKTLFHLAGTPGDIGGNRRARDSIGHRAQRHPAHKAILIRDHRNRCQMRMFAQWSNREGVELAPIAKPGGLIEGGQRHRRLGRRNRSAKGAVVGRIGAAA